MLVRLLSKRNSHSMLVKMQKGTDTLGDVLAFLTKLNLPLPYDPATIFPGIYPSEMKIYVYIKSCTQVFIASLLIIAKTWKLPRCPSIGDWMKELLYTQTMKCYSAIKRNEPSNHEKIWRNLKCMLLNERSYSEKPYTV